MKDGGVMRDRGPSLTSVLATFSAGAALMYLLDPQQGRRRRALVRDKLAHAVNSYNESLTRISHDMANRAYGTAYEVKRRLETDNPSDEQLFGRVRAALGRACSHPRSIQTEVHQGRVVLTGPAVASDIPQIFAMLYKVRGVHEVVNRLQVHDDAAGVPGLQGHRERGRADFENAPPRIFSLLSGTGLTAYGALRRDWLGTILGLGGTALMVKNWGSSALPWQSSQGIRVQKQLTINAPIERVYDFFANYQNFPQFMRNVRGVEVHDNHSHWTVAGPAGTTVEWEAVELDREPNRWIAWKSVEGSTVDNEGEIHFDRAGEGHTRINIRLNYTPPGGPIGHAVAKLFGSDPRSEMDEDLNRVKAQLEGRRQEFRKTAGKQEQASAESGQAEKAPGPGVEKQPESGTVR